MLKKRWVGQLCILLICLAAVIAFMPQGAWAASRIDTERDVSLTLHYQKDQAVPGVEFSLYRVAGVSDAAAFQLTGDFAAYRVSLENLTSAGWQDLAETLASYAARDGLEPFDSGTTDSNGILRFPARKTSMQTGLYLVTGKSHSYGGRTYTPSPFLITLPDLDSETDKWVYDVTADPKYTWEDEGHERDSVNRKVLKIWADDGNEEKRPQSIVVQLLRNGKVWDTVTLNEKNGWRYLWTDLDADDDWRVVEKEVPDGYTVSIGREGITFVVTNTCQPENPPDQPDQPENPPDEPENPPDRPDRPDQPNQPDQPGEPTIPQTGTFWWPVPILAFAGLLLFLLGWAQSREWRRPDDR